MGLDQFAFVNYEDEILPPWVEGEIETSELAQWRKHNRLEGWMSKLFFDKHPGYEGPFNCVNLNLTLEDLEKLEKDVKEWSLPETKGFFFGDDSYTDEEWKLYQHDKDLKFIDNAKKILTEAKELGTSAKIYYSSWW